MKRRLLAAAALGLVAATPPEDEFAGLESVSDAELAAQRGGFQLAGMNVSLGADIRTYLNGELALQTVVSWTAEGASKQEFVSGALTPAAAADLQNGILASGGITMRVGDQSVYLANQGQTALYHRTDGGLQNILLNRASNVDINQEVDASLGLGGYDGFKAGIDASRISADMAAAVTQTLLGSLEN